MAPTRGDGIGTVAAHPAVVVSLRLGPGEDLCRRLVEEFDHLELDGAALASVAGSLREVTFALAETRPDGSVGFSPRFREEGTIEIVSLRGHLGRDATGTARYHLHGAFALSDGRVVGGHLVAATVLATVEVTLLACENGGWEAVPSPVASKGETAWILLPVTRGAAVD